MSEKLSPQLSEKAPFDLLKQVINSMTDFVFFKGLDGKYLGCNLEYEKLIGKSEAEIVGKTAYDLNDVEVANIFSASDRTVFQSRMPVKVEIWLKKADGTRALFENTKSPLFDNNGEIIGILGVFRDITRQKEAEAALKASEEKYRLITENTSDVLWVLNFSTHHFTYLSPSVRQLWGYSEEDALRLTLEDVMTPESLKSVNEQIAKTMPVFIKKPDSRQRYMNQVQQICQNGDIIWVEYLASYQYDDQGEIIAVGVSRNIDERMKAEQALKASEEKYRMIAENTSDAIWLYNLDQDRFTYYSPSVQQLRGITVEEAFAEKILETVAPEFRDSIAERISDARSNLLDHPESARREIMELRQPTRAGTYIWVEVSARLRFNDQKEIEILGVSRNIEERKKAENEIRYLGYHDQMTGLFNRHYFETIITEEMDRSDRYGEPLSLLLLDLDHFKTVNDTWGHPVGDDLLKRTAKVIEKTIRDSDILVRFGGEEFIVLLPQTAHDGVIKAAEKIRIAVENEKHPVAGMRTVSIGVAQRMNNESFRHWYRRVDDALYLAKESGRNRVVASDENKSAPVDTVRLNWRSEWESGNCEIDKQHQELIEIANSLVNMSFTGMGFPDTMQQVELLLTHITQHFASEENILATIGYPGCLPHAEIHQRLVAKALRLNEACKNGTIKPLAFFSFMVDDVVLDHLMEEDTKFFPYTRKSV